MRKILRAQRIEILDSDKVTVRDFIESTGFKAIRWRDEYYAADLTYGATPATTPAVADVTLVSDLIGGGEDTSETLVVRLRNFDNGNRVAYGTFEMQHDIAFDKLNAGEIQLEAHVHWIPLGTETGDMVWQMDYMFLYPDGTNSDAVMVTATDTIAENSQGQHRLKAFGVSGWLAKPTGGFQIGAVMAFAIRRATSTYAGGAGLLKVALHVPIDDRGSRERIVK